MSTYVHLSKTTENDSTCQNFYFKNDTKRDHSIALKRCTLTNKAVGTI